MPMFTFIFTCMYVCMYVCIYIYTYTLGDNLHQFVVHQTRRKESPRPAPRVWPMCTVMTAA